MRTSIRQGRAFGTDLAAGQALEEALRADPYTLLLQVRGVTLR